MPTFQTPEPISVTLDLVVGDVRIVASDRADTNVEVRPTDPAKKPDVAAAAHTRVEYADGQLTIKAPKGWKQWSPRSGGESIDVHIELPTGSDVRAVGSVVAIRCTGRLGHCQFKTSIGEIRLDRSNRAQLSTSGGDITVERIEEHAELTTRTGAIRAGRIDQTAVIKNSNGHTWVGEIAGELRVSVANGAIVIDQAHAAVVAKTANGDIRIGEVERGSVVAETGCGTIDIGVREGVAAWLDLNTQLGNVRNLLDAAQRPEQGEDTVEIRARSSFGDLTIRRSPTLAHDPRRSTR
jgi:hypothetical protein